MCTGSLNIWIKSTLSLNIYLFSVKYSGFSSMVSSYIQFYFLLSLSLLTFNSLVVNNLVNYSQLLVVWSLIIFPTNAVFKFKNKPVFQVSRFDLFVFPMSSVQCCFPEFCVTYNGNLLELCSVTYQMNQWVKIIYVYIYICGGCFA